MTISGVWAMRSQRCGASWLGIQSGRVFLVGCFNTGVIRSKNAFGTLAIILMAAMLAACAQSTAVRDKSTSFQTASPTPAVSNKRVAIRTTRPVRAARQVATVRKNIHRSQARRGTNSHGLASFYGQDSQTASGEKFDPHQLTAAHPTLPFGTRVRVANMANGRSVTVRINDRGPYVPGRVVDVSSSAAEALRMKDKGVVNVKLDVLQ
jgi:rare lipoprotein A